MKKLFSILTVLALALSMTVPAFAAEYADIQTAYEAWETAEEYPDWVAVVCYTDENPNGLTVVVTSEEGEAELLAMLEDSSDVLIYVDEDAIPYNTLLAVWEEIISSYDISDSEGLMSLGIGWSSDESDEVSGYGSTGLECRIEVGATSDYVDEYTELFYDLYGNAVVVIEISSGTTDSQDSLESAGVEEGEDPEEEADEAVAIEVDEDQEEGEISEDELESEVIEDGETEDADSEAESEAEEDEDSEMTFTDYLLAGGIIVLVLVMYIFNKRTR